MTQYGFVVDTKRCIGCRTCVVSCKMENDVPIGTFRSKLLNSKGTMDYDAYEGTWPDVTLTFRFANCQQCSAAPCVQVCPVGATYKRSEDGIVVIDKELCIGCKSCIVACPYDARSFNESEGVTDKCDLCLSRLEQGLVPMCEYCCPARALTTGDFDDPDSAVSKLLESKDVVQLLTEAGTEPNVYYV